MQLNALQFCNVINKIELSKKQENISTNAPVDQEKLFMFKQVLF